LERELTELLAKVWNKTLPRLEEVRRKNLKEAEKALDRLLDRAFSRAETEGVEKFLDWYYSFGTDYAVAYRGLKDLKNLALCYAGRWEFCLLPSEVRSYLRKKVDELLLHPDELRSLLERELPALFEEKLEGFRREVVSVLGREVEKELSKSPAAAQLPPEVLSGLSDYLAENLQRRLEVAVPLKLGTSGLVGGAVFKLVLKLSAKTSQKLALKLTQKLAWKVAAETLSKALTAVSSAAVCAAVSGPLLPACAAAAGLGASAAADYLITKGDELLSRDDLRRELLENLRTLREELRRGLLKEYERLQLLLLESVREEVLKGVKLRELSDRP